MRITRKIREEAALICAIAASTRPLDMGASGAAYGLGLLKKCLPDISSVELTGEGGGAIELVVRVGGDA